MKEHFQLEHEDAVGREVLQIDPGCVVVTMRDANNPFALKWTLARTNTGDQDVVVLTARMVGAGGPLIPVCVGSALQRIRTDAVYQGGFGGRELWQAHFAAGGAGGRHIRGAGADGKFARSGGGGLRAFEQDERARAGLSRGPGVGGAAGAEEADYVLRGFAQWRGGVVPHWAPCSVAARG